MKLKPSLQSWLPLAAISLALTCAPGVMWAQLPTQYIASFDSDISAITGTGGNMAVNAVNSWTASGAPNGPSGGALKVEVAWDPAGGANWEEVQLSLNGGVDLTAWLNVELDIKVDQAASHLGPNGNYGEVVVICNGWNGHQGWTWLGGSYQLFPVATNGGWQHLKFSTTAYPDTENAFVIDLISNANLTNSVTYYIDNLSVTKAPLPAPTLGNILPPTQPGLTLDPAGNGQYQRVMVMPNYNNLNSRMGWYDEMQPSTYTFSIKEFPKNNDYAMILFWVPNSEMQYTPTDTAVDWNCTNYTSFSITANTNNPATNWNVVFSTKTNLHAGNPNFTWVSFDYPELPNGKWMIKAEQNTNFTITAPNGFVTNFAISADVADLVSGNAHGNTDMTVYYGIMNRALENIGVPSIWNGVGQTNSNYSLWDNFSTGFDTNTWLKLTDYAPDIFVNTGDLLGYLRWNTPNDTGFQSLMVGSSVNGPWYDAGVPSSSWLLISTATAYREALLSKAAVHAALQGAETNAAYFRLLKRVYAKLLVLLPGETNAPGTATGKTGTPSAQAAATPIDVTVMACDSDWYPVNSAAGINFTSNDPGAGLPADGVITLSGGKTTVQVTLDTGTWTVTATDASDATKTGTSTAITIP